MQTPQAGKPLRNHAVPGGLGLLLALLPTLSCGGGSSSSSTPAVTHLSIAPAAVSLSLPVPTGDSASAIAANGGYYPPPYSGTITVNVTKDATITGPVTLSVSGLPANVVATFAQASTTGTSDELSFQAGYPSTTDPTFTKQVYPALGTYSLTLTAQSVITTPASGSTAATSTTVTATTPLTLNLVQETADFNLQFTSADGSQNPDPTVIQMVGSSSVQYFNAYDNNFTNLSGSGSVTFNVAGVPTGLSAVIGSGSAAETLTLTAAPGLAPGMYAFQVNGSFNGVTRSLPVVVAYSPAPFYFQPLPQTAPIAVAQGGSVTFPLYLGHNDSYFGTVEPSSGNPAYVGDTLVAVADAAALPAGLTATLAATNPTGLASVPLTIQAGPATAPGTYTLTLQATRDGVEGSVPASAFSLPITVTAASAVPTTWIQAVEWGQTVVEPGLPLVAGKPALLRVQLLADRPGQAAPSVTATVGGTSYALAGPAMVPTAVIEGELPSATAKAGSSYTAILPSTAVAAGMSVSIQAGTLAPLVLTPQVKTGLTYDLTVVPVIQQGLLPNLPPDATLTQEMLAFWPIQNLALTHRAPYTTSTLVPTSTVYFEDGWIQLLSELASLKIVDKAMANYYGFFQLAFPASFSGYSYVGLSFQALGVGIGLDVTAANLFTNYDVNLDSATSIMVHEEGHAMNLNHAPAGNGPAYPQLNYPYYNAAAKQGAAIGSWGFDPAALGSYDPASVYDIMSYAENPHWTSDWDYLAAMGWLAGATGVADTEAVRASAAEYDQWVVSGWVDAAGAAHLQPLIRTTGLARPPRPGPYHLQIATSTGTRDVAFAAATVPDDPAGHRIFTFTVPASGEVTSASIHAAGRRLLHRAGARSLALRRTALAADAESGALVVREAAGRLHLEWDASLHPWVNVLHEGAQRTTLALHLTGGTADLPLDGLPAGGSFVVHYSDGLNSVVRTTLR